VSQQRCNQQTATREHCISVEYLQSRCIWIEQIQDLLIIYLQERAFASKTELFVPSYFLLLQTAIENFTLEQHSIYSTILYSIGINMSSDLAFWILKNRCSNTRGVIPQCSLFLRVPFSMSPSIVWVLPLPVYQKPDRFFKHKYSKCKSAAANCNSR
jgi:hypothetical protein